ncbi:MAG: hypothetical protein ABR509_01215 [Candidatus Limnocylindria bacterium]
MNDDVILEYLRSRAQTEPPLDLVPSVLSAVTDTPQRRASWFAPVLPAAVGLAAATVVVTLVVMLARGPDVGPTPVASPLPSGSAWNPRGPVATIHVREPYVQREGLPITVLDNPAADALFESRDMCTNDEDRYTVTFPAEWYTNARIGDVPACSWFTPELWDATDGSPAPDQIWISAGSIDMAFGYTSLTKVYFSEDVTIDGHLGHRTEYNANETEEPDYRQYHYVIPLVDETKGPTFIAGTDTDSADDYDLARAVLDRMMATLRFSR